MSTTFVQDTADHQVTNNFFFDFNPQYLEKILYCRLRVKVTLVTSVLGIYN